MIVSYMDEDGLGTIRDVKNHPPTGALIPRKGESVVLAKVWYTVVSVDWLIDFNRVVVRVKEQVSA